MGILKIVLFVFEVVLLADCARGEICFTHFLCSVILRVSILEGNARFTAHYNSSWLVGFLWEKKWVFFFTLFSFLTEKLETENLRKKKISKRNPKSTHGREWEKVSQPLPPSLSVCECVCTFTAAKPNKHHPSASQGERTQFSVGVQLSCLWPMDCLTSACVFMTETLRAERFTSLHCLLSHYQYFFSQRRLAAVVPTGCE